MTILNKNINAITFDDIVQLVEVDRPAENESLDYKRKVTDDIHKLISAFANTYGGWIIVGIDEDDTSRPLGIVNVDEEKLTDKIESKCIDNISPPVFCKSRYIDEEKGERRRVFIIWIAESDLIPHAVDYNTRVYVKTGAQKRKVPKKTFYKADLDSINSLRDRRNKYVLKRNSLISKAQSRFDIVFTNRDKDSFIISEYYLTPAFPKKMYKNETDLLEFCRGFKTHGGDIRDVRPLRLHEMNTSNEGLSFYSENNINNHYSEISCYGFLYNKALFPVNDNIVKFEDICLNLVSNLFMDTNILKEFDFHGSIILGYSIRNIRNKIFKWTTLNGQDLSLKDTTLMTDIDNSFGYNIKIDFNSFLENMKDIYSSIIEKFVFALNGGLRYKDQHLGKRIANIYIKE